MSNDKDYLLILDRINVPEKILPDRSGYAPICGEDGGSGGAPSGTSSSNNKETTNDMTVADNANKGKQKHSNYDFKLLCKMPRFRDEKRVPGNNDFSEQLNVIRGKDTERSETRDKLNAEGRIDMDMLTCSKNWQDKSARFPKSEESEELSKPRLSGEKKAERQGQLKSKQHLHATEQNNRQVPRKWADTLPLNATLFKALSTEELETLKNGIAMELKKMEERKPTSLENKREKKHIFHKPKVNITTESGNDIHLGQTIAGSGKKIATEEPTASSSRFAAADNTSSNAKTNKSENLYKEMTTDSYHELLDY